MRSGLKFTALLMVLSALLPIGPLQLAWAEEAETEASEVGKPKIDMQPFHFALIKQGRIQGKVNLHLVLVVEKTEELEKVRTRLPQLRSDFNSALTVLSRQRFSVRRPINPDIVKAYLTPYAERRLGPGVISIYVNQALVEPA